MPDVHFWYSKRVALSVRLNHLEIGLKEIVAKRMDCFDDAGNWIEHDPLTQIDLLTFKAYDFGCTKDAVIQIVAYDWPDRMDNIGERLKGIAEDIAAMLPVKRGPVAASFIPIPRGEYPKGCWVKV